ncbi:AAA family ATPase [Candidatus Dependentiae bacterium]|nr:AAA family ATPase [Candidatus Dependentiae bacterium]
MNILARIVLFLLIALFSLSSAQNHPINLADLAEPLDRVSQAVGKGISTGVADGLEKGLPGGINATAAALKEQFADGGNGRGAMQNFWGASADQFDVNGEGRRAAINSAESSSLFLRNVGGTLNSVITRIGSNSALISVGAALGVATAWYGSRVLWSYIERQMNKPRIIIKSSRQNIIERAKNTLYTTFGKTEAIVRPPMIFEMELQARLEGLIETTKIIHKKIKEGKKNIKYRNLLLYGPPGTGKTLFAQQLAERSGMEFAMASGSSFAKKGALEAMDELFAWANKSKGLILFIDEAESLMPNRDGLDPDSDAYRVFTNFLNYTGTRSDKFMIVLATNRLHVIDEAMHRRIDDLIELPLPSQVERAAVLRAYCETILYDAKQNGEQFVAAARAFLTDHKIDQMAQRTKGLSNGDLEGVINMIKTDADSSEDGLITEYMIDIAVNRMMQKQANFLKTETQQVAGSSTMVEKFIPDSMTDLVTSGTLTKFLSFALWP